MLTTIGTFRDRIQQDRVGLIGELQEITGRYGSDEARAWDRSLGELSRVFQAPSFQPLHLFFGSRGNLALEYQLPAASSWCDVVLLGAHEARPSAVILELKDWMTRSDTPGRAEGLIERRGVQDLHPSDQVRGYTQYCRQFHSAVADHDAAVHGCVLFTGDTWTNSYRQPPNDELTREYPIFTLADADVREHFPAYLRTRLTVPAPQFAVEFAEGRYRQDRGFVAQIGAQILNPSQSIFELLDNQRTAFSLCRQTVTAATIDTSPTTPRRRVVIINGPPGSGKSVIAAKLWAALVTETRLAAGDVVFTTTSLSQSSNWSYLFNQVSSVAGASGVIRKATTYTPVTTQRLGALRRLHGEAFLTDPANWRDNLRLIRNLGEPFRDGSADLQNLVTIVDEAHGLINPEHAEGRGQFGFVTSLGPQAYQIMRSSLVTVFLLDPLQGFRQRENTRVSEILAWARELGVDQVEQISLEGHQFRCGGSVHFVNWIEAVLRGAPAKTSRSLAIPWQQPPSESASAQVSEGHKPYLIGGSASSGTMRFRVFDRPDEMEDELRKRLADGRSARILSTYSRLWKTEAAARPHELPVGLMDFHEGFQVNGVTRHWSRVWNYVPRGQDYTWFVTGKPGSLIAQDPLCEVGCPYAVRGFDYDYVGILWLNDLLWRGDRWTVDPATVEERGMMRLVTSARLEAAMARPGVANAELLERVAQAYRILFTRALKGVYVWVPDIETRQHLTACFAIHRE